MKEGSLLPIQNNQILFKLKHDYRGENNITKSDKRTEKQYADVTANEISIGLPYSEQLFLDTSEEIKEKTNVWNLHASDLYLILLSCSFISDKSSKFLWAKFGVNLTASFRDIDRSNPLPRDPIVIDMIPDEITSLKKYSRSVRLNPKLKLELGPVKTDIETMQLDQQKEYVIYEPDIYAFGLNSSKVAWNFRAQGGKSIYGNKRDLILLVSTEKNTQIQGEFVLAAEIELVKKKIKIPFHSRDIKLLERKYELS